MARPKNPLLSPERIADAAMALVTQGRPFGVNAIARALGVTASSLYNHVAGKDEIVELMRARLLDGAALPDEDAPWEEFVTEVVRAQRRIFGRHPFLVPLLVDKAITDRGTLLWYDRIAAVLGDAGFADDEVIIAITMIDAFAIGFGLDLAGPEAAWGEIEEGPALARAVAAGPSDRRRSEQAFEWGLEALLAALRARLDG